MFNYYRFGDLYLQQGEAVDDVSTAYALPSIVEIPDGYWFYRGPGTIPLGPQKVSLRRTLVAGIRNSCVNWGDVFRDLRALDGTQARLWRRWYDNKHTEFMDAVFEGVNSSRGMQNVDSLPVDLRFQLKNRVWKSEPYGSYNNTDTDFQPDPARENETVFPPPGNLLIYNPGNVEVTDITIDITNFLGSGASFDDIVVQNITSGYDALGFQWSGILNEGPGSSRRLRVRTRESFVAIQDSSGTTGAWSAITLSGVARPDRLLVLHPGMNTINITANVIAAGGPPGASVELSYYGAYA